MSSSNSNQSSDEVSVRHLSFNQDGTCFAVGDSAGCLRVFSVDPFYDIHTDRQFTSPISHVEMLYRSPYFAIVLSGPNSRKVFLLNTSHNLPLHQISFRSDVKSVRLTRHKICVVVLQKVFVYSFMECNLLYEFETIENPKGLCEVAQTSKGLVIASLGVCKGLVRVEYYGSDKRQLIVAHSSSISCLALSRDGRFVATASIKGTLIRIFSTLDGSLLQEVRRGAQQAEVYSLAFSPDYKWLAVSSDKGTVHVFRLMVNPESKPATHSSDQLPLPSSPSSSLSLLKVVLPKYFSSEWSVAQFRLPEDRHYIATFGHLKNTVVILGMDGSFYRCEFDPVNGGEMTQLQHHNFMKAKEDSYSNERYNYQSPEQHYIVHYAAYTQYYMDTVSPNDCKNTEKDCPEKTDGKKKSCRCHK